MLRKRIVSALLVVCMSLMCLPVTAFAGTDSYPVMKADETTTAEITTAGEYAYFSFTPAYTESYTFYSASDYDTYGYLYDSDLNEIASDDDGSEGYNFSITYTLEAGVTYIWGCSILSNSKTGSFTVNLQTNHSGEGVVTKPASCAENGVMTGICTACGTEYTEIIPGGHRLNEENVCVVCGSEFYASGTCGDNLTWVLDSEGTLTVSGTGKMEDYPDWIDDYANDYANEIKTVVIENGVTSIGDSAFRWCASLTGITIPDSVTRIGDYAFYDCTSLADICVAGDNQVYSSIDGVLFNKEQTEILRYPSGKEDTSYTIPNGVVSIGDWAFSGCTSLTSVTFPNSLTVIGYETFYDCGSLTSITIPDSVTKIGDYAFDWCTNLAKIVFLGDAPEFIRYDDGYGGCFTNVTATAYYPANNDTWIEDVMLNYGGKITWIGHEANHVFDNACDKSCNVCGATKTITHTYTNACDTSCNVCGAARTTTHTYKTTTTKATTTTNGSIVKKCTVCGKVTSTTTIKYAKTFSLSTTSYTYNGVVKKPAVTVKDSAGKTLTQGTDYDVTYPSGRKNAGTYKVTVTMKGNYTGTKTLTFKINPAKIGSCQLSTTSYTYDGKVKKPAVTVKNSSGAKLSTSAYTVTYASGRKNVGTYQVTIKGQGNYSGTKTLSFKINPAKIGSCQLSTTSYTYDGNVKKPAVTVKNSSGTKLSASAYTATYSSGRKNVGTYQVTIKGQGNYTSTKTLTFKINPAKTTVSKLTAGQKSITVGITKKSTQVTGYQIQYSTSSKFTNASTKTITSYKTTKYTLKNLSAKKTYYVRVRTYKTVNGTKYYSGWSTYKYVKTK